MTESDEAQRDIKEMKWHIENLDNKMDLIVRGDEDIIESISEVFKDDESMCKVFLKIDGEKTQNDISDETDVSTSTVSRKIDTLSDYGLIRKKEYDNGIIYQKDDICSTLQLHRLVTPNGWRG